jgi:hypothetical protein
MNRRDALSRVALLLGGTVIGGELFLSGCTSADKKIGQSVDFTADDLAYLDEIAETIIPATDTPGAKEAKVGQFMGVMVKDCYKESDQKVFLEGMNKLNEASKKKFSGNGFMKITPEQRKELLNELDKEQKAYAKDKKKDDAPHYFTLMKQLTLLGYFTSEPGATKALRYVPVPGRFEACMPYKKGDKAWAL